MTITNETRERLLKEVIDERGEFLMNQMREMAQEGPPIPGHKNDPATRLAAYMRDTLPGEMPMILDPDYIAKVAAGEYPEPVLYLWHVIGQQGEKLAGPFASDMEAAQAAMQMGLYVPQMTVTADEKGQPIAQPVPPPIEPSLSFFGLLYQLPKAWEWTPFGHHAADFRNLLDTLGRRIESRVPEMGMPL
jgi:hypothetical protein